MFIDDFDNNQYWNWKCLLLNLSKFFCILGHEFPQLYLWIALTVGKNALLPHVISITISNKPGLIFFHSNVPTERVMGLCQTYIQKARFDWGSRKLVLACIPILVWRFKSASAVRWYPWLYSFSATEERAQKAEERAFKAESTLKEAQERIRALERSISRTGISSATESKPQSTQSEQKT